MPGFYHPLWLLGLLALPVLWLSWQVANKRRKKDAIGFSSVVSVKSAQRGTASARRLLILSLVPLLALGCLFIALADPHLPLGTVREGANVVLVIDDSGSMQATDYQPTRLEAAKHAASVLVRELGEQDRVGVVVFESGATTAAYLSPDKERVVQRLGAVGPKTGQTALGDGLTLAVEMADSLPNAKKVVILLSDGVSNAGVVGPLTAAGFARDHAIPVYTIGLGSDSPVVIGTDTFGNPEYADLDEETLRAVANETGGKYFTSVDETTLSAIYQNLPAEIVREPEEVSIAALFVLVAMGLIAAEFYLRYGRGRILP
jgi:Ca-activated chloride channel family protein